MEKWLVKIEAQQRKGVGIPSSEEEQSKEMVKSLIWGSSSGSLFSFRLIIRFLFPHLTYPGTLPWLHMYLSARMDLEVKASGRSKNHYGLALSRLLASKEPFCLQGAFLHMCRVSLVPKEGE